MVKRLFFFAYLDEYCSDWAYSRAAGWISAQAAEKAGYHGGDLPPICSLGNASSIRITNPGAHAPAQGGLSPNVLHAFDIMRKSGHVLQVFVGGSRPLNCPS